MKPIVRRMMMVVVLLLVCCSSTSVFAQCAMCRSTLENNYSNGNPGIAAGINTGILYLLSMPYLAAIILGYLWYKSSRNARKNIFRSATSR
jgi:hypothetical protein